MGRGGQNELETAGQRRQEAAVPEPQVFEMKNRDGDDVQVTVYGSGDAQAVEQLMTCLREGSARAGALMADHHLGYSMPIGGVAAYEHHISPTGVGFDIACGIKGVRTSLRAADIQGSVPQIMDEIVRRISFGMGRPNNEPVDHPVLDEIAKAEFEPQRQLLDLARRQLGTVGSGNHFVELCRDEADDSVWVITHFGSRGFGHKTAAGFLALAQGLGFNDHATEGEMHSPPVLFDTRTDLGEAYIAAMELAGRYAYAGRDVVCDKVLEILGAESTREVHDHHNFAWKESHGGRDLWVVRKGATPAFPGQQGVVGGSMEFGAVVLEGQDTAEGERSLYSTVHGAGRVMSRRKAAGKTKLRKFYACGVRDCDFELPAREFRPGRSSCPRHPDARLHRREERRLVKPGAVDWDAVRRRLQDKGIILRGGAADEAPEAYKYLPDVLAAHGEQIRVRNRLVPLGVAMAGPEIFDPYKD